MSWLNYFVWKWRPQQQNVQMKFWMMVHLSRKYVPFSTYVIKSYREESKIWSVASSVFWWCIAIILFIKILSHDIDIRFGVVFSFYFKNPIKFISTISLFTIYCNTISISMECLIENTVLVCYIWIIYHQVLKVM